MNDEADKIKIAERWANLHCESDAAPDTHEGALYYLLIAWADEHNRAETAERERDELRKQIADENWRQGK